MLKRICLYGLILLGAFHINISGQTDTPTQYSPVVLNPGTYRLEAVFHEISLQTGFFFTYDASLFSKNDMIRINKEEIEFQPLLEKILKSRGLDFRIIDRNIVIFRLDESAQPTTENHSDEDSHVFRGIIRDAKTHQALPFATIALNGTSLGSIANESGEFSFRIPADKKNPILIFSMLGYENYFFVSGSGPTDRMVVELKPRYISIQEVMIRYYDPLDLVKLAISKFDDNYYTKTTLQDAYFREITLKNKDVMTFSEAALEIEKEGFRNNVRQERVRVVQGRKILNASPEDSLILKIQSGVHSSLQLDIVKHRPDFLDGNFENYYNYNFHDVVYFRNRRVYVVGFKQKEGITEPLFNGQLYIDLESFAIVAAEFGINPDFINRNTSTYFIKKSRNLKTRLISANYHIEYSNAGDKYVMNQAHADLSFRFRKKRKWFASTYKIVIELAITDVDDNPGIRISRDEQLNPRSILTDQMLPADPEFWKNFNIILPEENLREAVERMGMNWKEFEMEEEATEKE